MVCACVSVYVCGGGEGGGGKGGPDNLIHFFYFLPKFYFVHS